MNETAIMHLLNSVETLEDKLTLLTEITILTTDHAIFQTCEAIRAGLCGQASTLEDLV